MLLTTELIGHLYLNRLLHTQRLFVGQTVKNGCDRRVSFVRDGAEHGAGKHLDLWIDAADVGMQHRVEERATHTLGRGNAEGIVFFVVR